jgi:hypothetical protein
MRILALLSEYPAPHGRRKFMSSRYRPAALFPSIGNTSGTTSGIMSGSRSNAFINNCKL